MILFLIILIEKIAKSKRSKKLIFKYFELFILTRFELDLNSNVLGRKRSTSLYILFISEFYLQYT